MSLSLVSPAKTIAAAMAVFIGLLAAPAVQAADLVVPSAAAVRSGLASLPARFAASSGNHITFVFGTSGSTRDRVISGEPFDLVIAPPAQIADLIKRGFLLEGRGGPLGTTSLGVAVKKGGESPPLATPEEFKSAFVNARAVGMADPASGATSGIYLAKLLADLGLSETLKPKLKLYADGNSAMEALARGEIDLAAGQISEIKPVAGVDLAAPLPAAIQLRTVYAVGMAAKSANPDAALALLQAMGTPETRQALVDNGFEVP